MAVSSGWKCLCPRGEPHDSACPARKPTEEQRVCTCPRTVVKGAKHTATNCPFRKEPQETGKPFELSATPGGYTSLSWPESENHSCDGEALSRDDMRALRDALTEVLGDG